MTLEEIRKGIDEVDSSMKELFIRRMDLAKQVATVKAQTQDVIYKPERETAIIERNSEGVAEDLAMEYKALLRRIMEVSRKYQYGLTLKLRDCFPYEYTTDEFSLGKCAMLGQELHVCDFLSKDDIRCVSDYEEMAELFQSGQVDTGIGIIEQIAKGVSDQLNTLLLREHLFINDCHIVQHKNEKLKLAAFSRRLIVRPEHNRVKLVLVAPNRSGALASLLSMIGDYGVNVTEIHSIPYKVGDDWNYRFFLELNLNLQQPEARALIFQLSEETLSMQLLGSYLCEGDFAS